MSLVRLFIFILIVTSSLVACSSYQQVEMGNQTSISQIKDSNAFIHSIKPSNAEAAVGQVISVVIQDKEKQNVTADASLVHSKLVKILNKKSTKF